MCSVAPKILNVYVGGVGFRREAVIADIDTCVCDSQTINVERVEAISVLRERGGVVAESLNVYIVKRDVLGANKESGPAGTVQEGDALNIDIGGIVGQEQNRTVVCVGGVLVTISFGP